MEEISKKLNETNLINANEKTDNVKVKTPVGDKNLSPVKEFLNGIISVQSEASSATCNEEETEVQFPEEELGKLDEKINRPQWVVPVLAKEELEILMEAAIDLCRRGENLIQ